METLDGENQKILKFPTEGLVQQRLLKRLQRGVLPLVEAGEALGFFAEGVELGRDLFLLGQLHLWQLQVAEDAERNGLLCCAVRTNRCLPKDLGRAKRVGESRTVYVSIGTDEINVPLETKIALLSNQNRDAERSARDCMNDIADARFLARLGAAKICLGNSEGVAEINRSHSLVDVRDSDEWNAGGCFRRG